MIRNAVQLELRNQLDPLRADIEALTRTYSAMAELTPALQMLARVPQLLGAGFAGAAVPGKRPQRNVVRAARPGRPSESDRGCAVIGCDRPHRSRGYCGAHYQQRRMLQASGRLPAAWTEDAQPQSVEPVSLPRGGARPSAQEAAPRAEKAPRGERACAVMGCRKPHRSKGYCSAHYQKRRLMEASGRLPASWVEDAAPHSVEEVLLPRGRRPRAEAAEAAAPEERKPSSKPRAWVRKKGKAAQPLVAQAAEA